MPARRELLALVAFAIAGVTSAPAAQAKPKKPTANAPAAPAPQAPPAESKKSESASPAGARETVQRESHIEFDERLVQGQTAAGAIYLFQRGEAEFNTMVKLPDSFRERTLR